MALVGIYSEMSAQAYGKSLYHTRDGREVAVTAVCDLEATPNYLGHYHKKWPDAVVVGAVEKWLRRVAAPLKDRSYRAATETPQPGA